MQKTVGEYIEEIARPRVQFVINRYEWFWQFSQLHEPLGLIKAIIHELYEKV